MGMHHNNHDAYEPPYTDYGLLLLGKMTQQNTIGYLFFWGLSSLEPLYKAFVSTFIL